MMIQYISVASVNTRLDQSHDSVCTDNLNMKEGNILVISVRIRQQNEAASGCTFSINRWVLKKLNGNRKMFILVMSVTF